MVACRDWQSTLRRASYRSVPFFVTEDTVETGRRLVVHEFPHKDLPYVEDLGRKANRISVHAYLTGEDVEGQERRLRAACEKGGAASLALPMARFSAHCEECRREYSKDRLGYIAFQLRFVREGTGSGPFPLLGLARAVEFAASGLVASLTAALDATFSVRGEPSYVADSAARTLQGFIEELEAGVRAEPIAPEVLSPLLSSLADTHANALDVVDIGAARDTYTAARFVATGLEPVSALDLVRTLHGYFETVREGLSQAPERAVAFVRDFSQWGEDPPRVPVINTRGARLMLTNQAGLNLVVRASALAQYAAALVLADYKDVRAARQAKADAAEFFEAQLDTMRDWDTYEVFKELSDLRAKVAEHFYRLITDMAPILTVSLPRTMPSLWLANRLYADAGRAGELVERNGVKHASFMPPEFEALAK